MVTPLETKAAVAGVITSVFMLAATFTAGGIYRNHIERETGPGNKPLDAANYNMQLPSAMRYLAFAEASRRGLRQPVFL
jgi:hypothetical protein